MLHPDSAFEKGKELGMNRGNGMQIAILTPLRLFGDSLVAALNQRRDLSVIKVELNFAHLQETLKIIPVNLVLIHVT